MEDRALHLPQLWQTSTLQCPCVPPTSDSRAPCRRGASTSRATSSDDCLSRAPGGAPRRCPQEEAPSLCRKACVFFFCWVRACKSDRTSADKRRPRHRMGVISSVRAGRYTRCQGYILGNEGHPVFFFRVHSDVITRTQLVPQATVRGLKPTASAIRDLNLFTFFLFLNSGTATDLYPPIVCLNVLAL